MTDEFELTPEEELYLDRIDEAAIRLRYMPEGDSLVSATGEYCWIEAWRVAAPW